MQTNEGNWYLEAACSKRRSSWKMARRMAWKDKKDKRNGSELQRTVEERCNIYLWETFAPENIEICKYMFVHLFSLNCRICFELGFHRFFDQCCWCLKFVLNVDMVLVLTNLKSVGNFILSLIDHPAKWLKRSPNLELCRSWICLRKVMKEASLTARPERSVVECNEGPLPQLLQWIFRALPAS